MYSCFGWGFSKFLIELYYLFIYLWPHWIFVAGCGLSLVVTDWSYSVVYGLLVAGASLVAGHGL